MARAAEALRKAARYDPTLSEAAYLLGKACQSAGQTREAARWYGKVVALVESNPEATADELRWKADAAAQLRRLGVYPKKWQALRRDFARRFRAVAAGKGGLPSCVRALEIASALTPKDEQLPAELDHHNSACMGTAFHVRYLQAPAAFRALCDRRRFASGQSRTLALRSVQVVRALTAYGPRSVRALARAHSNGYSAVRPSSIGPRRMRSADLPPSAPQRDSKGASSLRASLSCRVG